MNHQDELERVKRAKALLGRCSRQIEVGFGEWGTITRPLKGAQANVVVTLVEDVHFSLLHVNPFELGFKAITIGVSRLASLGAIPKFTTLTLGAGQELSPSFTQELYRGIRQHARKFKLDVVGAHCVSSPSALVLNLSFVGLIKHKTLRSGASHSDVIAVSAPLGAAASGMHCIRQLTREKVVQSVPEIVSAYATPKVPYKEIELLLSKRAVNAMSVIEDSLTSELDGICRRSKVGALINESQVPISDLAIRGAELIKYSPARWAYYGGEDFALLAMIPRAKWERVQTLMRKNRLKLFPIGEIQSAKKGLRLKKSEGKIVPLQAREWHHFVRRSA